MNKFASLRPVRSVFSAPMMIMLIALAAVLGDAGNARGALILDLRADQGVTVNAEGNVTAWADQSGNGNDASAPVAGPTLVTTIVNGMSHPVLNFDGTDQYLSSPPHVPSTGTMILVYSDSDVSGSQRRLVGWDDSLTGNNGIGLCPSWPGGGVLVAARSDGSVGDLGPEPLSANTMEVDALSWGAAGVTLMRRLTDGAVLTYSPDANITSVTDGGFALNIGSSGDFGTPAFEGELAEIQVFDTQLDPSAQTAIVGGLYDTWVSVPEPGCLSLVGMALIGLMGRWRQAPKAQIRQTERQAS